MSATDVELRAGEAATTTQPRDLDRFAYGATAVVVVLMTVESVLGLMVHGLYREDPWAIAALRGNDLVTLGLVVPALAVALIRSGKSTRWALVWLGGLLYSVYNFAYYAFGTAFNDVFLLHVATLTLSIAALVSFVAHFKVDAIASCRGPRHPPRWIGTYMVLVGTALIAAWGGFSLRFAISGQLPHDVMPANAVHLVYALDMSLLAPAFLAGGVLLLRHHAWGYALGVAVNLFGAAYLIVLEFVGGFQANAGIEGKTWMSPPALGGALLCAAAAAVLLRHLDRRTGGSHAAVHLG